jgi:transposase-like protein
MLPIVAETEFLHQNPWVYLYRAVDKAGQTVDFYLSEHRDIAAAKAFFRKAILHKAALIN